MRRLGDVLPASARAWLPGWLRRHRLAWLAVARKDVADAGRSWLLYALGGMFLALLGLAAAVPVVRLSEAVVGLPPEPTVPLAIEMMVNPLELLVPLTALVVGYRSIVGERERGSLHVLLGLPVTRRDVFVGKLLGRGVVIVATMLVGFAGAAGVILATYDAFDVGRYLEFAGLTVLLAAASTAIAIGISGFARSRARAMGIAITTYATFTFFWDALPETVYFLVEGEFAPSVGLGVGQVRVPAWFVFLRNLKLQRAYKVLVHEWVAPVFATYGEDAERYGDYYVEGAEPFYLEPWVSVVVLCCWAALFLGVGYWQFARDDLG